MAITHPTGWPLAANSDTAYSPSPTTLYGGNPSYANIGDLALLWVYLYPNSPTATTVAGTATGPWTLQVSNSSASGWLGLFTAGVLTIGSPDTLTVTYSGSTSSQDGDLWTDSISSSFGSATQWSVVRTGNTLAGGVTTFTYPSLLSATTSNPQAYLGWAATSGRATGGATAGFSYIESGANSGSEEAYNLSLASNTTYAPTSTCGSGAADTLACIVQAQAPAYAISHIQDMTPGLTAYNSSNTSTFGVATTVGNWIIAMTTQSGTTPVVPTGGGVGTWQHAATISGQCDLWYGKVTSPSQTVVTAPYVSGVSYPCVTGGEFSGLGPNPLITSTSVLTPAQSAMQGQLIVGGGFSAGGVNSPYTAAAGFTNFPGAYLAGGGGQPAYNISGWRIVTTPGTYQNQYTAGSSANYFATSGVFSPVVNSSLLSFF
jgi:hypothetical protein